MKPIRTPETNAVFKLEGGTDENDLPLERTQDSDGIPVLRSTWELTEDERAAVTGGANIDLVVWGSTTPPVALAVEERV